MGHGPSPDDNCSDAASVFMAYIVVNFFYNLLLLTITKRGSAVLLVMSQALSLPITNISFTLPVIMGKDAEPLSFADLSGLVLVCMGFLIYSGFGFADSFIVVQGAPGQMAYAHVDHNDTVIVSANIGCEEDALAGKQKRQRYFLYFCNFYTV